MLRYYHNDNTDKLFPWLTREWKKGRIEVTDPGGAFPLRLKVPDRRYILEPQEFFHWGDWFKDKRHPTRQGVDVMQHTVSEIEDKVAEWDQQKAIEAEERKAKEDEGQRHGPEEVFNAVDDWTMRKLSSEHLIGEGIPHSFKWWATNIVGAPQYQQAITTANDSSTRYEILRAILMQHWLTAAILTLARHRSLSGDAVSPEVFEETANRNRTYNVTPR